MSYETKDIVSLNTPIEELEDKLINEYDETEIKNIIDIFNLNIKKKNIIRTNRLSELQDKLSLQMQERIEKNADAFSNQDLLDYFKTVQQTIDKSDTSGEDVKIPVQIGQQINVNIQDELDRESRNRVIAAIQSIISKQDNVSDSLEAVEVVDTVSEESIEQFNEE